MAQRYYNKYSNPIAEFTGGLSKGLENSMMQKDLAAQEAQKKAEMYDLLTKKNEMEQPMNEADINLKNAQAEYYRDRGTQAVTPKPVNAPRQTAADRTMQTAVTKAKVQLAEDRPMVTQTLKEIDRVEKLNQDSYGGVGGGLVMKAKSALNMGTNDPKFINTTDVINTMQAQVAKILKSTFGGQLSDGERQYLNEVYGALPKLSQVERSVAMKNVKTMLNNKFIASQSKLSELQGDKSVPTFASEQEAEAANLAPGTKVIINGRPAVWE
jgi:hypothetical protein